MSKMIKKVFELSKEMSLELKLESAHSGVSEVSIVRGAIREYLDSVKIARLKRESDAQEGEVEWDDGGVEHF